MIQSWIYRRLTRLAIALIGEYGTNRSEMLGHSLKLLERVNVASARRSSCWLLASELKSMKAETFALRHQLRKPQRLLKGDAV